MESDASRRVDPFSRKLDYLCSEVVRALKAIETLQRRFFPPKIPSLQEEIRPLLPSLDQARRDTRKIEPSHGFEGVRDSLDRSAGLVAEALELITTSSRSDMEKTVLQVLQGLRKSCRAQEQLFLLRRALPTIDRFFLEPEVRDRASELDPDPPPRAASGLRHVGTDPRPLCPGSLLSVCAGVVRRLAGLAPRDCPARRVGSRPGLPVDLAPGSAQPAVPAPGPDLVGHNLVAAHAADRRSGHNGRARPRQGKVECGFGSDVADGHVGRGDLRPGQRAAGRVSVHRLCGGLLLRAAPCRP